MGTIWCLNTNNTKRLLPKMRVNLTKKRRKKWPKNLEKKTQNRNQKKKVFAKARPEIFSNLFTFNKNTPLQKKLHSILFGNWYHDSKTQRSTPPCLLFFSFAITRCFAKHFKYYYKYSLKLSIL